MLLSVIIPTCNRNDLLGLCLEQLSPSNQNLGMPYEVLVSDDSKNNTAMDFVETNFPWATWISGPKRGPAANRNNGAKHAKGEWLIFIDDDCLPTKQLLSEYVREIEKGHYLALEGAVNADREQQRYDEEAPINLDGNCFWSCNIGIQKKLFNEVGGFDENFPFAAMEDVDFHVRVKQVTKTAFLKNALVIHPWRRMIPFKSYKKHIASHKYFEEKYKNKSANYRIERLKILLGQSSKDLLLLSKYSFKGFGFYLEKVLLNFLLIFK